MSYVVLDIETTGLNLAQGAIVEIGAVKVLGNGKKKIFNTLVKPRVPIEPDALAAHGITEDEARANGLEPAAALRKLLEFVGDDVLVAHNGFGFDFPFLFNELKRAGIQAPKNRLLDTKVMAKDILLVEGALNLAVLCKNLQIKNERAHRALADASATAELMTHVLKKEPHLEVLWEKTSGLIWSDLLNLPAGYEILSQAIKEGLDLEMNYHGEQKPPSVRWIRPLQIVIGQGRHLSVLALCHREGREKQFRLDRIKELIQAGVYKAHKVG